MMAVRKGDRLRESQGGDLLRPNWNIRRHRLVVFSALSALCLITSACGSRLTGRDALLAQGAGFGQFEPEPKQHRCGLGGQCYNHDNPQHDYFLRRHRQWCAGCLRKH